MRSAPLIRPGHDSDAPAFIALIARCWADYPDCPLDVDTDAPELRALATYYGGRGGALWIAPSGTGMIATAPRTPTLWEICRVYVHPDRHGSDLARQLLDLAERHALTAGATTLCLWTDTRFHRAHAFYEKHGYTRLPDTRSPCAGVVEYGYEKFIG